MKKFMLGVLSSLGAIGIGKVIYDKGRLDKAKEYEKNFNTLSMGIELGSKPSKKENKKDKES